MRNRRCTWWSAVALLAVFAGWSLTPPATAGEEAPRDAIERLAPTLRSKDAEVRSRAERELFALGEAGQAELRRLADGDDPTLAALAMEYLQRAEWERPRSKEAPRPMTRHDLEREMERLGKDFAGEMEKLRDSIRKHLEQRLEGTEWVEPRDVVSTQSGTITENGRTFSWKKAADGKFQVTVQDGRDAQKLTFRFDSIDDARKQHPEIAKRLEEAIRRAPSPRIRLRFPDSWRRGFEDLELPDEDDFLRLRRQLRDWVDPQTDRKPSGPQLGILYSEPNAALRSHLGLERGGMVVTRVLAGSTAAGLGIEVHDVLVSVAGKPVGTPKDIREALASVNEEQPLTAVVYRRGARLRLQR